MRVTRMGQLRLMIDEVRAVHDVARAPPSPVRLTVPPRPAGGEQRARSSVTEDVHTRR
eukprot:CAMPEP_0179892582 /NCGR_PEP_ID=MMETSP0982-20121206/34308_1 /TAXON_ID=483367 /ORGANISM="non described non described, Strain CCMP 2436" /LENGTH=57 /DNA_ID=CAMNT_0021789073 /DNA_START=41 /DNA_END=211 /DNA_ORIENTATION=+